MEVVIMNVGVIGGADGPSTVYLAGQTGPDWINIFGFVFVVLLLLPNILYSFKFRGRKNRCRNKFLSVLTRAGGCISLLLMVFNVGIAEFSFSSVGVFLLYGVGNTFMILVYWIVWMLYFRSPEFWNTMLLAIIPAGIFLLSGITLGYVLLIISGTVYGIARICVTYQNAKCPMEGN